MLENAQKTLFSPKFMFRYFSLIHKLYLFHFSNSVTLFLRLKVLYVLFYISFDQGNVPNLRLCRKFPVASSSYVDHGASELVQPGGFPTT